MEPRFLFRAATAALLATFPCAAFSASLTITSPHPTESNFAEKRDFYVVGGFVGGVVAPGDVQVDVFRGGTATGIPVRTVRSHVDPATGLTTTDSMNLGYSEGVSRGLVFTPDLVQSPGTFLDTTNKCVVTPTYYAALIFGGVTKGFDTNYKDEFGATLEDLTSGTYTIRVSGLSGDVAGATTSTQVVFGRTHMMLTRFSPPFHRNRSLQYGADHGYRAAWYDSFAGSLYIGSAGYEIDNRWRPNNAVEVVNFCTGTLADFIANAENTMVVYNFAPASASVMVELGTMCLYDRVDSAGTEFLRYDIGEPFITYQKMDGSSETLQGAFVEFAQSPGLIALTRGETKARDNINEENLYWFYDNSPREIDTRPGDGVTVANGRELHLFGVARPIPSTVTPLDKAYKFSIDNRIAGIRYTVRNPGGAPVLVTTRGVDLNRVFDPSKPAVLSYSRNEWRHELIFNLPAGAYPTTLQGVDEFGADVPNAQTAVTIQVTGQPAAAQNGWTLYE